MTGRHCYPEGAPRANMVQNKIVTPEENPDTPQTEKIKVYKYDGSLQCGMGQSIELSDMQRELKNIKVYSAERKHDGLMRIQLCGSPTGNSNVYEIDRKDLEVAQKAGFKEWSFE